jgi:hypothetical protein
MTKAMMKKGEASGGDGIQIVDTLTVDYNGAQTMVL